MNKNMVDEVFDNPQLTEQQLSDRTGLSTATIAGMRLLGRQHTTQRVLPRQSPKYANHCASCRC